MQLPTEPTELIKVASQATHKDSDNHLYIIDDGCQWMVLDNTTQSWIPIAEKDTPALTVINYV